MDNESGEIVFGDGVHGAIPASGSQIKLTYHSCPHDGFVHYYEALKKVNPKIKIIAQNSSQAFTQLMGSTYPCDGIANHPLGRGFPSNKQVLSIDEYERQTISAAEFQKNEMEALQQRIDADMGRLVPYLADGLLQAAQLIGFQNIGIELAQFFLINDKPYDPNPKEALPARRWNARIISNE